MAHDATTPALLVPPVPLWRNRDYLLLWSGQTVSDIGTQVSQIAFPLLVLALTGSPAQAGFVAAARTVPYLLFALPAGAFVDRGNRKLTMIVCSAGSAVALASVAAAYAAHALTITQIVVVSFVDGAFAVFFGLAETSALPQVVHPSQLPAAVAQQQMQGSVGAIIGPPLGGVLFAISPLLPFAADAASYGASSLSLTAIRARFQGVRTAAKRSLRVEIGEGVGWLWRHPLFRYMAFLTGVINSAHAWTLIIIVLARQQGASPSLIGAIFAVGGGAGILGALIAPRIQRRFSFGQAIIGFVWCFTLLSALLSVAVMPALLMLFMALFGLVAPTYDTVQFSYRLAVIPDVLQGRVNSAFRLVARGIQPLGFALTGVLLERVGGSATALILAGILAVMACITTLNRHVRDAPALTV